jgi:hypothetical protein
MSKNSQADRKTSPEYSSLERTSDGWRPPGGYEESGLWALENRLALEQYAQRNEKEGTAAEQLQRFLAEHPDMLNGDHVAL